MADAGSLLKQTARYLSTRRVQSDGRALVLSHAIADAHPAFADEVLNAGRRTRADETPLTAP